jgi:hypothetical protein
MKLDTRADLTAADWGLTERRKPDGTSNQELHARVMEAVHVGPAFTRGAAENGWEAANAPDFKLRGSNYLKSKVKVPSEPSAFRLVGVSPCLQGVPSATTDNKWRLRKIRPQSVRNVDSLAI